MTKTELKRIAQDIIRRYGFNQPLYGRDFDFMMSLIARHPRATEKIGAGVAQIVIRKHPVYHASKTLWIIRKDGTTIDFSYQKCIEGENSKLNSFLSAARQAVSQEMHEYKTRYFNGASFAACQLSGEKMMFRDAHVDHLPPVFDDIAKAFIREYAIDLDSITYVGGIGKTFADTTLVQQWQHFHRQRANLRVIKATLNIQIGKHKPI